MPDWTSLTYVVVDVEVNGISDRYIPSGLVMQRFDGIDPAFLWQLNAEADRPDLAVILEADPGVISERLSGHGRDDHLRALAPARCPRRPAGPRLPPKGDRILTGPASPRREGTAASLRPREQNRHHRLRRIREDPPGQPTRALVNLPLTHLDGVYYNTDWKSLPQEEFAALQRDLVAQPRWLIEGNYAGTLPIRLAAADNVIFLDLHPITCLAGIAQRRWRYRGGQHAQDGVYDRITWNFVRYIWRYRTSMRPRVRQLLSEHGRSTRLVTLTSRRQAARFVAQLRAETSTRGAAP